MTTHFYGDGCTPPNLPTRKQAKRHSGVEKHDPVSFPVLAAYADGTLMTRQEFVDSLDRTHLAKVIYEWWEGCGPEYIERVFAWESLSHNKGCGTHDICGRCSFKSTVQEAMRGVDMIAAALGKDG